MKLFVRMEPTGYKPYGDGLAVVVGYVQRGEK